MVTKRQPSKTLVNGLDLTSVFENASVTVDKGMRTHFKDTRKSLKGLESIRRELDDTFKELESSDEIENFQIQRLVGAFDRADALASELQKKENELMSCIIRRIVA